MYYLKTKLRNTMLQKRLESLLLQFVKQKNLVNIQIEKVIYEFKAMNTERRHRLLYVYKLYAIINMFKNIIVF